MIAKVKITSFEKRGLLIDDKGLDREIMLSLLSDITFKSIRSVIDNLAPYMSANDSFLDDFASAQTLDEKENAMEKYRGNP